MVPDLAKSSGCRNHAADKNTTDQGGVDEELVGCRGGAMVA